MKTKRLFVNSGVVREREPFTSGPLIKIRPNHFLDVDASWDFVETCFTGCCLSVCTFLLGDLEERDLDSTLHKRPFAVWAQLSTDRWSIEDAEWCVADAVRDPSHPQRRQTSLTWRPFYQPHWGKCWRDADEFILKQLGFRTTLYLFSSCSSPEDLYVGTSPKMIFNL